MKKIKMDLTINGLSLISFIYFDNLIDTTMKKENLNYGSSRGGEWTIQITKLQISQQKRLNVSVYCTDY